MTMIVLLMMIDQTDDYYDNDEYVQRVRGLY